MERSISNRRGLDQRCARSASVLSRASRFLLTWRKRGLVGQPFNPSAYMPVNAKHFIYDAAGCNDPGAAGADRARDSVGKTLRTLALR